MSATAASENSANPFRRGANGTDLREPGGAQRQPRSAGCRARHSRDLRSHGR
jgi:hypothetical protein